jgi:CO/xanthine dehydrogenase Mo-binding subunit
MENQKGDAKYVRTNGYRFSRPMRGVTDIQGGFLENITADKIAESVNMDPVDWQFQNFKHV